MARSRSHDKKERGRSAEGKQGGVGWETGEDGRERGEGLINGRRHAPENIAGREGRKSGETAGGRQKRWREVEREDRGEEAEAMQGAREMPTLT